MDPLAIVQPRELSHGLNSKFETGRGIHGMLSHIVASDPLHARWLNTVSYLENCGARKIAACEHPTLVKEEMLKHASEEFRHAHYLKSQIERVSSTPIPDYSLPNLIGGTASMHYLTALDLKTSRYLSQTIGLSKSALRAVAYLLVTYAIEVRAEEFYPVYDQVLRQHGSKVAVKSILLEEKEHLAEMREGLNQLPSGFIYAEKICAMESELYDKWLGAVSRELCS
jgi:hypothetical protein